jgi:hypothetical protein
MKYRFLSELALSRTRNSIDRYLRHNCRPRNAVKVAKEMAARAQRLKGVRIDSDDLVGLAIKLAKILDDAEFPDIKISEAAAWMNTIAPSSPERNLLSTATGWEPRWAPRAMRNDQICLQTC